MNSIEITLRKRSALHIPAAAVADPSTMVVLQIEAMNLGFVLEQDALKALANAPTLQRSVMETLSSFVAADKDWEPMYPNFPKQVFEAPDCELYLNAFLHYWTHGTWAPSYTKETRLPHFETVDYKAISLIGLDEYMGIYHNLLASNASLPRLDRDIICFYIRNYTEDALHPHTPKEIPFKETLCLWVAELIEQRKAALAHGRVQTATDVLRIATRMCGGDISLVENTKFRLPRRYRRWLLTILEPVIRADDVIRHLEKWKRLFHCIHVGSYPTFEKCRAIAFEVRNGRLRGYYSHVEKALETGDEDRILELLSQRPGEFARRLDMLLRRFSDRNGAILKVFSDVAHKVDTRVLLQMLGHFMHRKDLEKRIVIPKGSVSQAYVLREPPAAIQDWVLDSLVEQLKGELRERFSQQESLGKVWIEPHLQKCPIPLQLRAASEGLKMVQRGTKIPFGEKNILRFFVHWIGDDLDLSACLLREDLTLHSAITYYNLSEKSVYCAVHSGDFVKAPPPKGACEFIDIDIDSVKDPSVRYVAMDVRVFSGGTFQEQQATAGWMLREEMGQKGEVFDAQTVDQRICISAPVRNCMVALFDLQERDVIWLDMVGSSKELHASSMPGNNVENNKASIQEVIMAAMNFRTMSLYDLFTLHAEARGELVETRDEALSSEGTLFDMDMLYRYDEVLSGFF